MTTRAENRARWTEIVERFRRSGMTKAAFARQEKLLLTDLKNWHYRLPRTKPAPQTVRRQAVRLVPVAVQPMQGPGVRASGQIVVDIQALQVAVGAGADPALVADLVVAIRKQAC